MIAEMRRINGGQGDGSVSKGSRKPEELSSRALTEIWEAKTGVSESLQAS